MPRPLELPEADLPVPPYALGVWLGDGTSAAAQYTSADPEIAAYIEAEGLVVVPTSVDRRYALRLPAQRRPRSGLPDVRRALRAQDLAGADLRQDLRRRAPGQRRRRPSGRLPRLRWSLGRPRAVPGLPRRPRHGQGAAPRARRARATSTSRRRTCGPRSRSAGRCSPDCSTPTAPSRPAGSSSSPSPAGGLAEDARELIASLGHRVRMTTKRVQGRTEESSTCYTLTFSTDDEVFRLERKKLLHKERGARTFTARGSRFITDVRPIASVPVRCIQVDAEDHLFLAGRSFIPTHNSTLGLDIARSAASKHHLATRHLLAGNEQARDHHASALGRGEGAAAPHARRHAVATRTGRSWPAGWARSPTRRSTSTTPRT